MNLLQRSAVMTLMCFVIWTVVTGVPIMPVLDTSSGMDNATIEKLNASFNGSQKNLYVVKAVVYEIGILTEEDDNETFVESQERVDLTFFDTHSNKSHIDLGNIPLPIQTNVSGQVLTGIAPVHLGAFSSPDELLSTLPLTGTIVNLTHSDTAYFQLTSSNTSQADHPKVLTDADLAKIPEAANYFESNKPISNNDVASVPSSEVSN